MNTSEFFVEVLKRIGITHAFSLVGGMSMHINRAAINAGLSHTYCNHEQAVVAAADGYSKAGEFNSPSLAIVTSGPGVTNTVTSLASAYYDSVPLILLSGQVKSADINSYQVRSYGAQEVPHISLLKNFTKISVLYDPDSVTNIKFAEYLATSMVGRKGPVHFDIPLDIQSRECKSEFDVDQVISAYYNLLSEYNKKNYLLPDSLIYSYKKSKKPLLVLGSGLKIASCKRDEIKRMIENIGCPVLLTWASMDLIETEHQLVYGCAGGLAGVHSNKILQNADWIIFIGVRLDLLTTGFKPNSYGKNAIRYIVDCDDAELSKNANLSNVNLIRADAKHVLKSMFSLIDADLEIQSWIEQCNRWRAENKVAELREFNKSKFDVYNISKMISKNIKLNYIVPTASGFAIEGFARFYQAQENSSFAWAGHVLGSMGLALPSAIGASVRLKKCVACVDGDGGFLLNMQEMYTLRANKNISIAIFILNNKGYTSIRNSQLKAFNQCYGANMDSGLADINFEEIAILADLEYIVCHNQSDLDFTLNKLTDNSRILIDLMIDDEGYRGPSVTTKFNSAGSPYTTDIEEISWR